jgi:AraC-like DNA-binding protein
MAPLYSARPAPGHTQNIVDIPSTITQSITDMKYIITGFIIITASMSLVGALGQLLVKERKLINYVLFAQLFCLTILLFQGAAFISGILYSYPIFLFLNVTALYLIGVIRYFAYFLVSLRMFSMPGKKFLYFIPSCAAALFDLYFLFLPGADKAVLLSDLISGSASGPSMYLKVLVAGAGLQATVLWGIIIAKIIQGIRAGKSVILYGTSITYNVLAIAAMNILVAGYLLSMIELFTIASAMLGLLIIGTFLMFQMNPEFLEIIAMPASKKRYSRSRLAGIETDDLHRRVMELVEREKIYADENVTLTDCADELSITPHQLSEFLNERLSCNFYSFINQHRIKEAVKLLVEEPERTILSIAHIVGFNSKSSFYDSFTRFMGMTPNQYRSKFLKNKEK